MSQSTERPHTYQIVYHFLKFALHIVTNNQISMMRSLTKMIVREQES